MTQLPTLEAFRTHIDAHDGIFDPHGELTKSRQRTHSLSILAGAYVNSFHSEISAVLNACTISRDDPYSRTRDTLEILDKIEYGEEETAVGAAERLWKIHSHASTTLADGRVLTATDTDLLGVSLITGFRCTAAMRTLEHLLHSHDQAMADELFASYWAERAGLMAAVGIPFDYLPESPVEAVEWWSDQLERHLRADAAQITLEGILDDFTATAATQVADKKTSVLAHALSGPVVRAVRAIAYQAAPEFLRDAAWPEGPPAFGHAIVTAIPATSILPDWMAAGLPRQCPEAHRVAQHVAEEDARRG